MTTPRNTQDGGRDEKILDGIVIAIVSLVLVFFVYGISVPQPCNGIDNDSLYCAVRSGFINKVGALLVFATIAFFLAFKPIFGSLYLPKGSTWISWVAFAAGVLGVLLTYAG